MLTAYDFVVGGVNSATNPDTFVSGAEEQEKLNSEYWLKPARTDRPSAKPSWDGIWIAPGQLACYFRRSKVSCFVTLFSSQNIAKFAVGEAAILFIVSGLAYLHLYSN